MKQIERLLFLQGGRCFFCKALLDRDNASVEHLQAVANGGANADSNCVVCCRAVNAALGSLALKEKIQAFLNQQGNFVCPARKTTGGHGGSRPERVVDGEIETVSVTAHFQSVPKLTATTASPIELAVSKPAATEPATKKPGAKESVAKKATAKKPAVEKATVKTAAKKTAAKKAATKKAPAKKAAVKKPSVLKPDAADVELAQARLSESLHPPTTEAKLNNWLGQINRTLSKSERNVIIDELKRIGSIRVTDGKLSYHQPTSCEPNADQPDQIDETEKPSSDFLF